MMLTPPRHGLDGYRFAMKDDAEIWRKHELLGLSLMRIAKLHDCRVSDVREALLRGTCHAEWHHKHAQRSPSAVSEGVNP